MLRPVWLLGAALLSSTTLAQAAPTASPKAWDPSPYAAYLVGREAMSSGDKRLGAAMLEDLAARYPDQPILRRQAFEAALFSGDIAAASALAPTTSSADDPADLASIGRLARAANELAISHAAEADKALDLKTIQLPYRNAAVMLKPWTAAAAGDWKTALAEPPAGDRVGELVAGLARAQLFEIRGRNTEAEAVYKLIIADALGQKLFKTRYGEFLERTGRVKDAIALYDSALKIDPDNTALISARAHAKKGARPPALPSLRQGGAQALTYAAAAVNGRQAALGLIYLRLALRLDGAQDEALLMLGDDLLQTRDGEAAREAWAKVPETSPLWIDARTRAANSLMSGGDAPAAIALARASVKAAPQDMTAAFTLADMLHTADQETEALSVLDRMLKTGGATDWRVRYMRAVALDKLGRWNEAEPELKTALELSPDEPEVENYLGYTWIDKGTHIKEGVALVEKAVAARPNSGAMQDSLGWAHYRQGDFKTSVTLLEKAVELDPTDPDINDHLGDAYWMGGRKFEARYQWNRVLSLKPSNTLKADVERKLKDGVAAGPAAAH